MTRRERRALLAVAVVLAVVCSALFARAVFARRAADLARAQASAALLAAPKAPASDFTQRAMLDWSDATGQMRYWQALQAFRLVASQARTDADYTLQPPLPVIFKLEATASSLRRTAEEDPSPQRRSRLEDMLGLAYFYDAELHQGQFPVEPALEARATAAFRSAVLLDGSNAAAKTNLELLLQKQRRRQKPSNEHPKLRPDQTRAENAMESSTGLPSQNGAIGRRYHGGY